MKVKCLLCDDIVEGDKKGNLISCKCEKCFIDETPYYYRLGGDPSKMAVQNRKGEWVVLSKYETEKEEVRTNSESQVFYIFLDIDGVLNCETYIERCYNRNGHFPMSMNCTPFYPTALKNLGRLYRGLKQIGLEPKLILSSTWRLNNVDYEIVNARLAEYGMYITDKTPVDVNMRRGIEIERFLKDKEYKDFIILDDEDFDIIDKYPDNLIQTSYKTGFDNKMLLKTYKWLEERNYVLSKEEEE